MTLEHIEEFVAAFTRGATKATAMTDLDWALALSRRNATRATRRRTRAA